MTLKNRPKKANSRLQSGDIPSKIKIDKDFKKARRITSPLNKRLYDLKEAATYLARPIFSVRTLIWNGKIPVIKDGRKLYLDVVDLDGYIEKNKMRMV